MKENREEIIKIIISGVLLVAAIFLTEAFSLSVWIKIIIFAVPYLTVAIDVLKEAAENIFHGEFFDEEFLMSIATLGAFVVGEYPEAVFVMLFFSVGELFEHIASDKSRRSVSALMDIRPDNANLEISNGIKNVPAKSISVGDVIVIKPGERIALDGIVLTGETAVDCSPLTGESAPVEIKSGSEVFSGCVNLSGVIRIRVIKDFDNSTATRILELAENAAERKTKTERFITRFSRIYTPVVVGLAILLAIIPSIIFGNVFTWLYRALMFLVVSCPCALVVSVPLSYFSGIGCASNNGILIKGSDSLESLAKIKTVLFDKTGTLTHGSFSVTAVHPKIVDESELLRLAAAAEQMSNHPIALSLKAACKTNLKNAQQINEIAGRGVSAIIDGKKVLVGNGKLMEDNAVGFHECHLGGTVVHVAVEGEYCGHIVISDSIKKESKSVIAELKNLGIDSVMLTGDHNITAQTAAKQIGLTKYYADLLPEGKVEKIEDVIKQRKSEDEKVAFVGDGINDAPVIARADIGIAMGAVGSDAAMEAADVVFMDDNLQKLPFAVKLSRKVNSIVRQNVAFALLCKAMVLIFAAFGIANMWFASFADVGVLVLVVLNAMRALKFRKHLTI